MTSQSTTLLASLANKDRTAYTYVLLLALGGLQLALGCRTSEFPYDPYYYELARSLLAGTGYGFNGRPEPMVPPGFPALLAALMVVVGHSYAVLIRSMAFFTTFGLMAAYEVLRSQAGRAVAAITCLLLASSPSLFGFSTRMLFSDMPYFLASFLLLLAAARLDSAANRPRRQAFWWGACMLLLVASILLRSTGIALAGGILGWLAVSLFRERKLSRRRIALFLPLVAVGVVAEAGWVLWAEKHPVSQWPVHGFQESYAAQLRLKSGNHPELGMATLGDVLKRPLENEDDMATSMVELFGHKQVSAAWYSPATVVPLSLLLIGLVNSFRLTGGAITEWYFLSYQFLYLFWPWNFELRFQVPVAPLAALYIWRGGALLWRWARAVPRLAITVCFALSTLGAASSAIWGWHTLRPHPLACIAVWLLASFLSAVLLTAGPLLIRKQFLFWQTSVVLRGVSITRAQIAGGLAVLCILLAGVWTQTILGLENIHTIPEMDPNIEAAQWIRENSPPDAVVMARWEARVYHYSDRRVIWFPASTDPKLLMSGMRRHKIRLIVVIEDDDEYSYWKPSDSRCFKVLVQAYPERFRSVHEGRQEHVYEFLAESDKV
jgi:hypothetical protein